MIQFQPKPPEPPQATEFGYSLIPLSKGLFAKVDNVDLPLVEPYRWFASEGRKTWYAVRYNAKGLPRVRMHRALTKAIGDTKVDHKNGDGLDNRRDNLRICSHNQNQHNRGPNKNNTSGFKGVCFTKVYGNNKWMARIVVRGREIFLGRFATPEEAALAYNAAAEVHYGEFSCPNIVSGARSTPSR